MKSKVKLISFSFIIFLIFLQIVSSSQNNNIEKNFSSENDEKYNCDETQDPENAKRCNLDHMTCEYGFHNCVCNYGYITNPNFNNETKFCDYEQKSQFTAFLLELLVGFGAGHFYRKAYIFAIPKLIFFIFGYYTVCCFPNCEDKACGYRENEGALTDCCACLLSVFYFLYSVGMAFWCIWDLVYFGTNRYGEYGDDIPIPLKHW